MRSNRFFTFGAFTALMIFVAGSASAQTTNYTWTGGGDGMTWSQPANWMTGIVPVNDGTTFQIFLGTGNPTASVSPITIGVSDNIVLGDQIFGPEWGQTLNINGTVNAGFGFAPVGDTAGNTSVVNMYGNSSYTSADSIFIGDMFWFDGGPNVTINLYDNSQMTANYVALGGHLNIYGGTVTVNNTLLTGTSTNGQWGSPLSTDATRLINMAGGELVLAGDATAQLNDMMTRGILEAYGGAGTISIDTSSSPGQTIVMAVPEPSTFALLGMGTLIGGLLVRRKSDS